MKKLFFYFAIFFLFFNIEGNSDEISPVKKDFGEVFNVGGEVNNYTKQGIVDAILEQLPNAKVKYKEHGVDPRNYRVDFSKVKKILAFEPKYTVPDGIKEVLIAFKNHVFDHGDDQRNVFGNYELQWDAGNHASGMYIVEMVMQLENNEVSRDLQKILYLK